MSGEHKLAIKVLRLGRPQLQTSQQFQEATIYSNELVLPNMIGPCYAGEYFKCILAVIAQEPIQQAHLTVEMQTSVNDSILISETEDFSFEPESPYTTKLEVPLDKPGPRVLAVAIKYKDGGHVKTLSKTFTFDVGEAVKTRTKVHKTGHPSNSHTDAIELQVENSTESMLNITLCEFKSETYKFDQTPSASITLKPRDVYSFGTYAAGEGVNIGRVEVKWSRDPLGYKGSMIVPLRR